MNEIKQIEPEYVYVTIPAEYICVYHRILAMMADYGEDMLKDCKANCTDRNSGVIECFNMFNSAVAARKLGKDKLAALIIKYIKVKINQIYKDKDNSTSFVFPVDETGQLKAFVSCGERPKFEINPDDMNLYEHKFNNGFDEHFKLGPEDESKDIVDVDISSNDSGSTETPTPSTKGLSIVLLPRYENVSNEVRPCADINVYFDGEEINVNDTTYQYYFDDKPVNRFNDVSNLSTGVHNFKVVITYNGQTKIESIDKAYNTIDIKPDKPIVNKKSEMYKTVIANKPVPYFTAQEGKIYYTNQFNLYFPNSGFSNNDIEQIEQEIKNVFGDDMIISTTHYAKINDENTFSTLLEAYNNWKQNNSDQVYIRSTKRFYCGKCKNGFVRFNTPPYGHFDNTFNFPDIIDLEKAQVDPTYTKKLVLYRYRHRKNRIFNRDKSGRIDDIVVLTNSLGETVFTRYKYWTPYDWDSLYNKYNSAKDNGNNINACTIIRISVKHNIKYGFAYYRYDKKAKIYRKMRPQSVKQA